MKSLLLAFSFLVVGSLYAQTDTIRIFFELNSSEFRLGNVLLPSDVKWFKLEAYCDTSGTESYNYQLAQRRALAVKSILPTDVTRKIEVVVHGEPFNVQGAYIPDQWRRVDVIFQKNQSDSIADKPKKIEEETTEIITVFKEFIEDSTRVEQQIDLTIQFYPGLEVILPQYEQQLWVLFDFMHYHDNISIEINGHVCCADDYPLSYRRAKMVYDFLLGRAISPQRMNYEGFSNNRPKITPEQTELDRQRNRRVEVIFRKN